MADPIHALRREKNIFAGQCLVIFSNRKEMYKSLTSCGITLKLVTGGDHLKLQLRSVLFVVSALALSACTVKEEKIIEREAPANASQSFSVDPCQSAACLTIQKKDLNKLYLLIASGKYSGPTPQWVDFKPQVVSFVKLSGRVAILEENFLSIYDVNKSRDLVQSFAIVKEDADSVTFDWGKGLTSIFSKSSYDIDLATIHFLT